MTIGLDLPSSENLKLGKKAVGRLCETIKPFTDKKTQDLILNLGVNLPIEGDINFAGHVNNTLPQIFSALFPLNGTIDSVEFDGCDELLSIIVRQLKNGGDFSNLFLTIGLGGSTLMPSIRMPAYIIPALESLKSFLALKNRGLISSCPRLRIFKAENIASKSNGFDFNRVHDISIKTFDFIRTFVETYYPELLDLLILEVDADWMRDDNLLYNEARILAERISAIGTVREEVDTLLQMGDKHGGDSGKSASLFYAAAHPIYNRSLILPAELVGQLSQKPFVREHKPCVIIDHGGRPQRIFNAINIALRNDPGQEGIRLPLINVVVKSGKVPVYYHAREYDLLIGEDVRDFDIRHIDRLTEKDFKILFDIVPMPEYLAFLQSYNASLEATV